MKKIILVSALVMLFVSATPIGVASADRPVKVYHSDPVSTQVDSVNVMVKELLELTKKL